MKKNLVKKSVLPVFVALLCSVIALTSVSYAWFSMGNKASVETLELSVTSASGMQVSSTGNEGTFKSLIPLAELTEIASNQMPKKTDGKFDFAFTPVSTTAALSEGLHKFWTGTVKDNGTVEYAAETTGAKNYMYFDLYFKSNGGQTLYFDISSTVLDVETADKNTSLGMRVSFVYFGSSQTPGAAGITNLASSATEAVIWEPNATQHTQDALNRGAQEGQKSAANGVNLEGAKTAISLPAAVSKTVDQVATDGLKIADMTQGYHKVRVYIWLEGEDIDCANDISGGSVKVDLKFFQAPTI